MCGQGTTPASPERFAAMLPIAGTPVPGVTTRPGYCDPCIHPLVQTLNDGGFVTIASCCGHGKVLGRVTFIDGRELLIAPDHETATRLWVDL